MLEIFQELPLWYFKTAFLSEKIQENPLDIFLKRANIKYSQRKQQDIKFATQAPHIFRLIPPLLYFLSQKSTKYHIYSMVIAVLLFSFYLYVSVMSFLGTCLFSRRCFLILHFLNSRFFWIIINCLR